MIVVYGMSEKLPNISLVNKSNPGFLGQASGLERRSEHVEMQIDMEVSQIINQCYEDAKKLLSEKHDLLDKMANILLEQEVINHEEIKQILGKNLKQ